MLNLNVDVDTEARNLLQALKNSGVPGCLANERIFDRNITFDELYMYVIKLRLFCFIQILIILTFLNNIREE